MAPDKQFDQDRIDTLISSLTSRPQQVKPEKALRARAEERTRQNNARIPVDLEALSPQEIREAFHELRVHQIELEMQNDELMLTQAELEMARSRYYNLYNLAPVGYCIIAKNELIMEANLTAATLLGVPQNDLANQPITRFVHKEDRDVSSLHRKKTLETGEPQTCEVRMVKIDGAVFWARLEATAAQDENGAAVCRIVLSDITEAKLAEVALQQSEQRTIDTRKMLQLVLDTIPVRLYWKDLNAVYLGCNRLFAQDAGCRNPEELIGADDSSLGRKEQTEIYNQGEAEVMASGISQWRHETIHTAPSGKQTWLSTSKVPIRDANDRIIGVLGVNEDVTHRKWVDEELLKAQKIESLGLLAGGIAHDFNNILMVVMGNISFAKMMLPPTDVAYERLTFAETALLRAKDLTQQFLTFSEGGAPVKRSVSLARLIKVYGQLALCGTKSTCEYTLPEDLWNIDADDGQIGQVLTNILVNADQSMREGGIITVKCHNQVVDDQDALPLPSGKYVKISIQDQGSGIPEENLDKIFDPYFTTKDMGRGLGLTAAHSIIKKHEGYITVESTPGSGTTVSLFIPAAAPPIAASKAEEGSGLVAGGGRILVMDDDALVLQVVKSMLERLGYEAALAVNGEEAITRYVEARQSGKPFAAVIMDLIVPGGMGGEELMQKLLMIDPQVRAIVSSGYCYDPVMADYRSYGFEGVIAKPYLLAALNEQMQQVLLNQSPENKSASV